MYIDGRVYNKPTTFSANTGASRIAGLTSADIMTYPFREGDFILDTNASDHTIGAVLSQIQNGTERVVSHASQTMSKAEKNYCVTDKELLSVHYFVEYFRQYLLGRRFKVRTDHQALVWLISSKKPKSRITRWLEILSEYDFSVEYRPGPKHDNANFMTRCEHPKDCSCPECDNLEMLQCGPGSKCRKRDEDMNSERTVTKTETIRRIVPSCPRKHRGGSDAHLFVVLVVMALLIPTVLSGIVAPYTTVDRGYPMDGQSLLVYVAIVLLFVAMMLLRSKYLLNCSCDGIRWTCHSLYGAFRCLPGTFKMCHRDIHGLVNKVVALSRFALARFIVGDDEVRTYTDTTENTVHAAPTRVRNTSKAKM